MKKEKLGALMDEYVAKIFEHEVNVCFNGFALRSHLQTIDDGQLYCWQSYTHKYIAIKISPQRDS